MELDLESWQLGIELVQTKYEKEAQAIATIVANRQREYARLESELDGYFKMRAREEMTLEEFKEKKADIRDKQSKLQEKIDDGMQAKLHWLELMEDYLNIALQARSMIQSDDLDAKRKAVVKVGWNLALKSKQLEWTYRKPYDILLKPEYRSDLRARWDYFQMTPWLEILKYPDLTLQQTQQFLTLSA